jgi:type I restriction-modification system DNA methylase subunit
MNSYGDPCSPDVKFETKDSGKREQFTTGMERDTNDNKPRYDLIWLPGIRRVAELMARGAKKYTARNWEKASTEEELNRFKESALRHMYQYLEGDRSEDHMAAVVFNLFGAEHVLSKLQK